MHSYAIMGRNGFENPYVKNSTVAFAPAKEPVVFDMDKDFDKDLDKDFDLDHDFDMDFDFDLDLDKAILDKDLDKEKNAV